MPDEQSQEELLKRQKENCIFCKILKGEVPSKQVYEDEGMTAILDINPAAKGHTLVMPNEHYPIMPLIPPEEFTHLFGRTAPLSKAIKQGAVTNRCTVFIANGPLAGQQSPHFLFHIVPRENDDGLTNFDIPQKGVNQSDIAELMKQNLYSAMREHLQRAGQADRLQVGERVSDEEAARINEKAAAQEAAAGQASPEPVQAAPQPPNHDQLAALIEANPEIRALLLNNPEKLATIVKERPEFQQLFAGVDIKKLGEQLRRETGHTPPDEVGGKPAEHPAGATQETPPPDPEEHPVGTRPAEGKPAGEEDIVPARDMTMTELFTYIDNKERLKEYILEAPEKLKELIPENERLRRFFEGADVDAIITAYTAHASKKSEGQEK